MKKLVIIIRSCAQKGGVENHVYEILKNSGVFGYDPILISLTNAPADNKFKKLGMQLIVLNDSAEMSHHSILNIYTLFRTLKKLKPDIVHCHGPRPIFVGSIAARLAGIKNIIATFHGSYELMLYETNGRYKLIISKIMHTIGFSLSKCIITVSKSLASEIEDTYRYLPFLKRMIAYKIRIIHNGIDTQRFKGIQDKKDIKTRIGINNHLKAIGTVGRLVPVKGINILLQAAKHLFDKGYLFEVLIVGDGCSKNDLMKLSIELGINKYIHFLGFQEEPAELYNIMDIFVLPSLSEGFTLVNIEAMACRIPVISTNVGGISEAVTNLVNGIIIPSNNVIALANALKLLIDNDAIRLQMGLEGEKTVQSHFTNEIMLNKIFTTYHELS